MESIMHEMMVHTTNTNSARTESRFTSHIQNKIQLQNDYPNQQTDIKLAAMLLLC